MQCCSSGILPIVKYTNGIDSDPGQSSRRAKYTFLLTHNIILPGLTFPSNCLPRRFPIKKLCKHLYFITSKLHAQLIVSLKRILITYTVTEIEFFDQCRYLPIMWNQGSAISKMVVAQHTWLTSSRWKQQVPPKRRQLFAD